VGGVWVVVLIKDFHSAKQRLRTAMGPEERSQLARANAHLALRAAAAGERVVAVCGSDEAAALAGSEGAEVLLEATPGGQNQAAATGLEHASRAGAAAVLLLSSDLPLITVEAVQKILARAEELPGALVMAIPATGRGGTNGLLVRPPDAVGLHFGDQSLKKFEADALARGVRFELFASELLALDLDEPSDLAFLASR